MVNRLCSPLCDSSLDSQAFTHSHQDCSSNIQRGKDIAGEITEQDLPISCVSEVRILQIYFQNFSFGLLFLEPPSFQFVRLLEQFLARSNMEIVLLEAVFFVE